MPFATFTCPHVPPLQLSVVQAFPSSQLIAVPTQTPLAQASPVVQALLSVQVVPFATFA
jgi:hypothetical protein